MEDISPELLELLKSDFRNKFNSSKKIEKLNKLLLENKASYKEANEYAIEVGNILAEVFKNNLKAETFPDNKMYYNIAKKVVEPNLNSNYDLISEYSKVVQSLMNEKSNIGLKAIKPPINQDRIDGIINRISEEDNFEDIKWILDEPVKNFSHSIVDDTIKTNAEFQYKSGLRSKIKRKEFGKCCDWCREVVGEYDYPDVPDDVYKRHRHCMCTLEYLPGNGKSQDVWGSKKWKDIDESDKIEKRIELSEKKSYKKFHEEEQVNQYFEKESKLLWSKEYQQAREAFMKYTQSGYKNINSALRDRQNFMKSRVHFSIKEETFKNIKHMKNFIDKQELKENIVVYRSIDKSVIEKQVGSLTKSKGKIFSEKAFSSTSPLQEKAKGFYGKNISVCIEYHIPKGIGRGTYINSVSEFENVEYEYLLNTDTRAKIIEFKKENNMDIVVMEVLDNEIE